MLATTPSWRVVEDVSAPTFPDRAMAMSESFRYTPGGLPKPTLGGVGGR